jgi:hypothetical protein
MVDFRVVGMGLGSVRLLLEPPLQASLPAPDEDLARKAFGVLEDTAVWMESGQPEPPETLVDQSLRMLALRQLEKLSPGESDQIAWIEISGPRRRMSQSPRLNAATHRRVTSLLRQPAEEGVEITGKLRAIDLDQEAIEIGPESGEGQRQKCRVPIELLAEALEYIVAQTTIVVRGRRVGHVLEVAYLSPVD